MKPSNEQPDLLQDIVKLTRFGRSKERPPKDFEGTSNPRHLRVLRALLHRHCSREEIDAIAGASNGPECIRQLLEAGLEIPCFKLGTWDRDGQWVQRGVYALTPRDRGQVVRFFAARNSKGAHPAKEESAQGQTNSAGGAE